MAQAPVLNALYKKIENDPQLKNKVKILAAVQGQDANNAKMWKTFHKVPFPVVPDTDSKLGKALNYSPYPVTVLLDKSGKLVWVHVGAFESVDEVFPKIKQAVK